MGLGHHPLKGIGHIRQEVRGTVPVAGAEHQDKLVLLLQGQRRLPVCTGKLVISQRPVAPCKHVAGKGLNRLDI
ncbi:hypothetical protein D3C76_1542000 [compost metagenome]